MDYFIVCANGRSGTTFTLLTLGRLSDVDANYEMLFYPQTQVPGANHVVLPTGYPVTSFLNGVPGPGSVKGSKLIFGYAYKAANDLSTIRAFIDSFEGVKIVHIVRDYFELIVSRTGGPTHDVTDAAGNSQMAANLRRSTAKNSPDTHVEIPPDMVRTYFVRYLFGDLIAHGLCRAHSHMRVAYSDLGARIPEIASFIGSKAGPSELDEIIATPATRPTRRGSADHLPNPDRVRELSAYYNGRRDQILESGMDVEDLLEISGKSVRIVEL